MAYLRYIEIDEEELELDKVNQHNGQIIFCRDTLNIYADTNDSHRYLVPDIIQKVDRLPTSNIDENKLYYVLLERKLYRYLSGKWIEANSTYDIFDLVADNEDILGIYLSKDNLLLAPVTGSELVIRPNGESAEESFINHESEIRSVLDPLHRYIYPEREGQTIFILPLPYETFLNEFNTFSLYKNKLLIKDTEYTIDYTNNNITLKNPTTITDTLEVSFHYIRNEMYVVSEWFQSEKNQTDFKLTQHSYTLSKNMVNLYINGIKQPKESFTEIDNKTIRLKNVIPKGSFVVIEIGKWIPHDLDFYSYFENKTERKTSPNTIEIVYPISDSGHSRKILKSLDSNGNVILEVAYVDGIEVSRMTITRNNTETIYTVTEP